MDKQAVIRYFDDRASQWDEHMVCSPFIIDKILDGARLRMGASVLDVACGTGVMFPFYMSRGVSSVTAIDISPEMAKIAEAKAVGLPIEVICGDAEEYDFGKKFDCCVIYNAFPHFTDRRKLISALAGSIKTGGTLTVAHGMSESQLRKHHEGSAASISESLPSLSEMSELISPYFKTEFSVSNEHMYQITGRKL